MYRNTELWRWTMGYRKRWRTKRGHNDLHLIANRLQTVDHIECSMHRSAAAHESAQNRRRARNRRRAKNTEHA
jgi:hypothetical protein